jgi:alpha-L-fucosidase
MLLNRRMFCRDIIAGAGAAGLGLHTFGSSAATLGDHDGQSNRQSGSLSVQNSWFREGRYGLMISFSVYSLLERGSWGIYLEQIPVHEYKKLMFRFNPTAFNAKEWVQLAKDSGQKYLTFVAKHRDGFSMYDTKLSDFSIMHTPFGRDICHELADECRRQQITFNIYYQLRDWTNPAYRGSFQAGSPVSSEYIEFVHGQVGELCTNYGKLGALWFDGGVDHTPEQWRAAELIAMVRQLQPDILIDDRTGLPGDFSTPEEDFAHAAGGLVNAEAFRPPVVDRLWERCVTMNDHWGFDAAGERYKSPERIVQLLVETAAAGGNLILDVAPNATGKIDPRSAANLRQAGEWMRRNGDSIYGTEYWGRIYYNGVYATARGKDVHLHVFDWKPGASCDFPLLGIGSASRVYFLGHEDKLHLKSTPVGLRLVARNPNSEPSPDTVVVFEDAVRTSAGIESVPL